MKTLINRINQLRQLKEEASEKYWCLMDEYSDMLVNELIHELDYERLKKEAEAQTNYNKYCNELFEAEKELINKYKQGLQSNGLYSNDIAELFNQAAETMDAHYKLVDKIISVEGDITTYNISESALERYDKSTIYNLIAKTLIKRKSVESEILYLNDDLILEYLEYINGCIEINVDLISEE